MSHRAAELRFPITDGQLVITGTVDLDRLAWFARQLRPHTGGD